MACQVAHAFNAQLVLTVWATPLVYLVLGLKVVQHVPTVNLRLGNAHLVQLVSFSSTLFAQHVNQDSSAMERLLPRVPHAQLVLVVLHAPTVNLRLALASHV